MTKLFLLFNYPCDIDNESEVNKQMRWSAFIFPCVHFSVILTLLHIYCKYPTV